MAAESRAKIVYERLIAITDDPRVKDALGFLMVYEIAHQKAFEKALYAIDDDFQPGTPQTDPIRGPLVQHVPRRRRHAGPEEQRPPIAHDCRAR
jgi:Mn-containing catalase